VTVSERRAGTRTKMWEKGLRAWKLRGNGTDSTITPMWYANSFFSSTEIRNGM
jgi:hypothetical protein